MILKTSGVSCRLKYFFCLYFFLNIEENSTREPSDFDFNNILKNGFLEALLTPTTRSNFLFFAKFIHLSYPKSKNWGVDLSILKQTDLNQGLINNLGATIILSKNILKTFQQQKKGNLILFSSIYGVFTPRFSDYPKGKIYSPAEYAVMKSGTISFVKYLAKKYQKKGIRINCISWWKKDGQNINL